jgi:hypothetical protein
MWGRCVLASWEKGENERDEEGEERGSGEGEKGRKK